MLEKIQIEKVIAVVVTYLTVLSICYNNGFWSTFNINIFNYYGLQDILKGVIAPFFQFGALIFFPLFAVALILLLGRERIKKEKTSSIDTDLHLKSKWLTIARKVYRFVGWWIIASIVISVLALSLLIYPVEDQSQFLWIYLKGLNMFSIFRAVIGIFIIPMYSGIFIAELGFFRKLISMRVASISSCLILTLFISYHYGRLDAYRIFTGYEFLYSTGSKNGEVQKYLGKVNNYNFFLINNYLIGHNGFYDFNIPMDMDKVLFKPLVSIVSDDSLKSIRFNSYSVNNSANDTTIYKKFILLSR